MVTSPALQPARAVERPRRPDAADALGFLAGKHYTCYCGRSLVGTMLCPSCADEMVECLVIRPRPDAALEFAKIG